MNQKKPRDSERPFPRQCPNCGKDEVYPATIPYDAECLRDARMYRFHVPALQVVKCRACGECLFTNTTDDQIQSALQAEIERLERRASL